MVDEATGGIAELLKFFSNESAVFGDIQPSWARANASRAELLRGDLDSAAGHLDHIPQAVMEASRGPVQNAVCCGAYAAFAVEKARAASAAGRLDRRACRECLNALRRDLRNGRKFAPDRTEAWKLAGNYYWFAGSRRRALVCWQRSIRAGERLRAKVELSHTLMDAGKLLGETPPGYDWRKRGAELRAELGMSPT